MKTEDILLIAVTLVILGEVTYLLTKLPKTALRSKGRAILVDTSVLMDGRIISVATSGFISGSLVIPRSVVGELQLLADGSDSDKRARARYGLDVVSDLQKLDNIEVEILQDGSRADEGVDERLLILAKRHNAAICTLDFNLNKVAVVESIQVLNINELAQGLRMSHLPGDRVVIELVQKGQDAHQAVGYLSDGTMVVVEQASAYLGKSVDVEVIRSLQTAAGKMMFARRIDSQKKTTAQNTTGRRPQRNERTAAAVIERVEVAKPHQPKARLDAPGFKPGGKKPLPRREHSASASTQQRPAQQQARPAKATLEQKRSTESPQQLAKPTGNTPRRNNRRRPDREAALIALVNEQNDQK